jgi:sugar (pentulose or hexulose) kinase
MSLLLGIDFGTSYFKLGLFDPAGTLRGLGRVAVPKQAPAPERCELPVADFWRLLREGLAEALAQAGSDGRAISAVSYSSQANTFVLLDEADREITPLIVWSDRRAHPLDADLAAFGAAAGFGRATGMGGLVPELAGAKCRWFSRHEPGVWARARRVLTISDYFTYRVTGEANGDASTAALTGYYDLHSRAWWPDALAVLGLRSGMLAKPLPPGTAAGRTVARAGELLGLPAGIPFAVGALDHHAAALGSGLGEVAEASLSTGTVLAALVLVDKIEPAPGRIHGPHADGVRYYRLAFDPDGAGQVEAYQRQHAPGLTVEELLRQAGQSPQGHGTAVRALLRKIAASQRDLIARVAGESRIARVTATGGGARSPFWLQVTADTIGLPVVAVASPERACLGAAMMASVAAGIWPDIPTAAKRMLKSPREFLPLENAAT